MNFLFKFINKDKQTESLVEKLAHRFQHVHLDEAANHRRASLDAQLRQDITEMNGDSSEKPIDLESRQAEEKEEVAAPPSAEKAGTG